MNRLKESIEKIIPMTLGSFVMFIIIVYLMIIVGKTVWTNYQSNQEIVAEQQKLVDLEDTINNTQNQIAYFKTNSFKEKQARAKLGYAAPGETAVSVPIDDKAPGDQKVVQQETPEKIPNYYLWYAYFFN